MTTKPLELTCERCGIDFTLFNAALVKRMERGVPHNLCSDCQTIDKPILGYQNNCRAWMGDVDELDRPIRNGKLYKPGVRTCNRADCVRLSHIIPEPKPEKPQKSPVRRSEPVKVLEQSVIPKAVIKPSKSITLPKAFIDELEAERLNQTYRGEPKLTLKQLKKAVELERYRITPR